MNNEDFVQELIANKILFGSEHVKVAFVELASRLNLTILEFQFTSDDMSQNKKMGRVGFTYRLSNNTSGSLAVDYIKP